MRPPPDGLDASLSRREVVVIHRTSLSNGTFRPAVEILRGQELDNLGKSPILSEWGYAGSHLDVGERRRSGGGGDTRRLVR